MKSYLGLRAAESKKPITYGIGLRVSLEELSKRIIEVEKHLDNYPNGRTTKRAYEFYLYYLESYIKGTGGYNIHVDYQTKKVLADVLESYNKTISENMGTKTAKLLQNYLDLLKRNDYKADSSEVENYYSKGFYEDVRNNFYNLNF